VEVTGSYALTPSNATPLGPGNVNLPGATLSLGAGSSFKATQGSTVALAGLTSDGVVSVVDTGSLLSLRSGVAGDANTANPLVNIGSGGIGSLNVGNGAVLRIDGLAPASPALFGQGAGLVAGINWSVPAFGRVDVSGAGSRLEIVGTNPFITIASGPKGGGQLSISNAALVQTTLMGVADWGASGSTLVDNATLRLDGAWRDGAAIGASLAVGNGAGSSGTMTLTNGARVLVANSGSEFTNFSLGGLDFNPGGSGVLNVSGGSMVNVSGAGGSQFVVGLTAGGVGVATFAGGSTLNAGYVGVSARAGADTGGIGTLVVNDTSSLTATTLEVGAKGFVGGTGTINADVVNRGVFSPGNSPGTLTINGSFSATADGKLVLEVRGDGSGGFVTDHLVFGSASGVNLAGLAVEFRFLPGTDPNAFLASGRFDIDNFIVAAGAALPDAAYAGVSFAATSSDYQFSGFSYSASGGAVFQATPVPEPGSGLLMGLGLAAFTLGRRRLTVRMHR
jgi:hypothetical protein